MICNTLADIPGQCLIQVPFPLSNSDKSQGVLNWWVPSSGMRLKPRGSWATDSLDQASLLRWKEAPVKVTA